jgi:N-acetylmuramoyl-L-alanine amidase
MRKINKIIIHCTATKEGQLVTIADVAKWHKERGFATVGYHFLIDLNGKIETGRNIAETGAHTIGYNTNSIGICYVGGLDTNMKPKDTRTQSQKTTLVTLLKTLKSKYPNATIHGHNEFAKKDCPCFDVKTEYQNI